MAQKDIIKIADVVGEYQERVSTKTGRPYKCISLKLSDKFEKIVFLDDKEQFIFESENDI